MFSCPKGNTGGLNSLFSKSVLLFLKTQNRSIFFPPHQPHKLRLFLLLLSWKILIVIHKALMLLFLPVSCHYTRPRSARTHLAALAGAKNVALGADLPCIFFFFYGRISHQKSSKMTFFAEKFSHLRKSTFNLQHHFFKKDE